MVIFSTNALYAVLSVVFIVISGCFVLFILEVEFLAFILMLLYIGAITVLFLFVVMMTQSNKDKSTRFNTGALVSNSFLIMIFGFKCFHLSFVFNTQIDRSIKLFTFKFLNYSGVDYSFTNTLLLNGDSVIFLSIFTQKYYLFLIVSVILLFSMIGSIVLCSRNNL
jgi:NADH-quinone oxidoreductase subunit J